MPEICHCINATSIFVERDCVRIARTPEVTLTRWRSLREEEIPIVAVIVGFVHQIMFSFTLNVMIVSPKWSTFFSLYSPLQILPRTSSTPYRFLTQIIRRANILSIVQFSYHQTNPIAFRILTSGARLSESEPTTDTRSDDELSSPSSSLSGRMMVTAKHTLPPSKSMLYTTLNEGSSPLSN